MVSLKNPTKKILGDNMELKEVSFEEVKEVFNSKNEVDKKRIFADAFGGLAETEAYVHCEDLPTCDCPVCGGVVFFEDFVEDPDDDEALYDLDYDGIRKSVLKIYKCKITHKGKALSYDELKKLIFRIEGMKFQIQYNSIYGYIYYDGGEEFKKAYEKLCEELYILDLPQFREVEIFWLNYVYEILETILLKDWFNEFAYHKRHPQTIWKKPVLKALEEIGVKTEGTPDTLEEWDCLYKMLKYLVPEDKRIEFSTICRRDLKKNPNFWGSGYF